MLRASNRVLKPGGAVCFVVIAIAPGLDGDQQAEAIQAGPPHVSATPGYPDLMNAAGFSDVEVDDVTDEYLDTLRAWHSAWDAEAAGLRRVVGADSFAERQTNRRRAIEAVEEGLLRRYLISATRLDPTEA